MLNILSESMLVAQSCLTLCDSMDGGLPGSSVHGIIMARILERLKRLLLWLLLES